jgi:hypothetical protein
MHKDQTPLVAFKRLLGILLPNHIHRDQRNNPQTVGLG